MNLFLTLLISVASALAITFCIDMIAQLWHDQA